MSVYRPKLILSDDLPSSFEVGCTLIENISGMKQAADDVFHMPLEQLRPTDRNKVGIHIIALGDYERYGLNKNGDGFPEAACRQYHPTFVSHGKLYQLHQNKDPSKKLGDVVASAYNPHACRVEVFVHADRDRARPYLQHIAQHGTHPYSMAAYVPWDECTVCKHRRWFTPEGYPCEHVRKMLSCVLQDGTAVGTLNWLPTFHDISFVHRGADRIAYDVGLYEPGEKAASSDGARFDSLTLARYAGLLDQVADGPRTRVRRGALQKLAAYEMDLRDAGHSAHAFKAAANWLTPADIAQLRHYEPRSVLKVAADNGVVFSYPQFCQFVYGEQVPEAVRPVAHAGVFKLASENIEDVLQQRYFDVDSVSVNPYSYTTHIALPAHAQKLKYAADMGVDGINRRTLSTLDISDTTMQDKISSVTNHGRAVATIYAAYALGALDRQCAVHDDFRLRAVAAQNLQHKWS